MRPCGVQILTRTRLPEVTRPTDDLVEPGDRGRRRPGRGRGRRSARPRCGRAPGSPGGRPRSTRPGRPAARPRLRPHRRRWRRAGWPARSGGGPAGWWSSRDRIVHPVAAPDAGADADVARDGTTATPRPESRLSLRTTRVFADPSPPRRLESRPESRRSVSAGGSATWSRKLTPPDDQRLRSGMPGTVVRPAVPTRAARSETLRPLSAPWPPLSSPASGARAVVVVRRGRRCRPRPPPPARERTGRRRARLRTAARVRVACDRAGRGNRRPLPRRGRSPIAPRWWWSSAWSLLRRA